MLASALGCLGATLSIALPWPQVWRCWAGRRTTGLSASATWLGVALPIGWITYGLLLGDPIQIVTNLITGTAGIAVLAALLGARLDLRRGRKLLVTAAGAAVVLTAVALSGALAALPGYDGPHVAPLLGGLLAGTSIVAALPQPMSLLRDRTQDLSGLSMLRWQLAAAAATAWFGYGLATGQAAVWASASAGLAGALIVCVMLRRSRAALAATRPVVGRGVACVPSSRAAVRTAGPARAPRGTTGPGPRTVRRAAGLTPVRGTAATGLTPVRGAAGAGLTPVRGPVRPIDAAARAAWAEAPTEVLRIPVAA